MPPIHTTHDSFTLNYVVTRIICLFISIIQTHVAVYFRHGISGCYAFRLTRNSDLFLREEELMTCLGVQLKLSRYILQERSNNVPKIAFITKYHLRHEDTYYCDGPVNIQRYSTTNPLTDRI